MNKNLRFFKPSFYGLVSYSNPSDIIRFYDIMDKSIFNDFEQLENQILVKSAKEYYNRILNIANA